MPENMYLSDRQRASIALEKGVQVGPIEIGNVNKQKESWKNWATRKVSEKLFGKRLNEPFISSDEQEFDLDIQEIKDDLHLSFDQANYLDWSKSIRALDESNADQDTKTFFHRHFNKIADGLVKRAREIRSQHWDASLGRTVIRNNESAREVEPAEVILPLELAAQTHKDMRQYLLSVFKSDIDAGGAAAQSAQGKMKRALFLIGPVVFDSMLKLGREYQEAYENPRLPILDKNANEGDPAFLTAMILSNEQDDNFWPIESTIQARHAQDEGKPKILERVGKFIEKIDPKQRLFRITCMQNAAYLVDDMLSFSEKKDGERKFAALLRTCHDLESKVQALYRYLDQRVEFGEYCEPGMSATLRVFPEYYGARVHTTDVQKAALRHEVYNDDFSVDLLHRFDEAFRASGRWVGIPATLDDIEHKRLLRGDYASLATLVEDSLGNRWLLPAQDTINFIGRVYDDLRRNVEQDSRNNEVEFGEKVETYRSEYNSTDKYYEDTYSINKGGEWLGECGAMHAQLDDDTEDLGIEFWLFDKDEIKAESLRLVPKGKLTNPDDKTKKLVESKSMRTFEINDGEDFIIETQTMNLQIHITSLEQEHGKITKMTADITVYRKKRGNNET